MNVDDLRSVLRTERQKDSLQQLRESFYEDVAEYIAQQKAKRQQKAEQLGTPYSPEIRRLTDEIETAEEVVTSIYERRVGKVVKAASFAAAGMSSETAGLTHEEQQLFDDLVARIEENRGIVLSALEDVAAADSAPTEVSATDVSTSEPTGTGPDSAANPMPSSDTAQAPDSEPAFPPDEPDSETAGSTTDAGSPAADAGDVLADAMGTGTSDSTSQSSADGADASATDRPTDEAAAVVGGDDPTSGSGTDSTEDDPLSGLADERETVRITADVGTILGVDEREYDLANEDVVTLPAANVDPLVERGAAEKLE
ncbi:DNA replication protein [Haloferax mediterranei ATCC 33500]|uniref:DNA replication protein n=1 Tax=Haloferax mediterranei (strain ATCC 33500 / DSM 1411 / JCM 8866 / NBRC 14739 / NCIMB 2177 / R-4) TaxID=523841 RepID=I3R829_HALMT|nr:hypothetical protein [Haloferax mediterranei]AFK20389.1 hypothetical protein HFX_2711 [Haloferax mediterranei ATCC 33500]AHZ23752.1 DNA replication protein [Haloferax mediterranei ATCC 33500]ELZ99244.1 hypothetical protein C439_15334 [Haloferax mediterranei ATCC 33500]MDX5986857.1 DNA replication protein [Haloferax mediterranei ATCC 33500]QCQ76181.1 DNA replication protein [Haloferax mediterranei ATCC 33500]